MSNLQEAFREAARREFAMVPAEEALDYTFSPGFQRKMRRIIRAQAHGYWQLVNTTAKRIACVAAIIMMLLTTAMAIKPVRERVIKFFVEVYEEYFEITFGEENSGDLYSTTKPLTRYTLTELPVKYYESEFVTIDTLMWTTWKANDGGSIYLQQEPGVQQFYLDNTGKQPKIIQCGATTVFCQTQNEFDSFIWEQDGYVFSLSIHDDLKIDQIKSIITSLKKIE